MRIIQLALALLLFLAQAHSLRANTDSIQILNQLAEDYRYDDPAKSLETAKRALLLAEKANMPKEIMESLRIIGNIYLDRSNFQEALKYYTRMLKLAEQTSNKRAVGNAANFIGNTYNYMNNADKALEYYHLSLKNFKELGLKVGEGMLLNNIGIIYMMKEEFNKAADNFTIALKLAEETDDKEQQSNALGNLGNAYTYLDQHEKAIIFLLRGLKVDRELNNIDGVARNYFGLGVAYEEMGDIKNAIVYQNLSLEKAKQADDINLTHDIYRVLSRLYAQNKDYAKAYELKELYVKLKDSIFNLESAKQIAEIQTQYETEKKEKEILLLTKDRALKEAEVKRQRMTRNMLLGGSLMLIGVAFWRVRVKQKTNKKLQEKNQLIETQKDKLQETYSIIEEKNKDITDSIHYAQRIQQAILPSTDIIHKTLPESFIFYQPKDIVSGDFYFFAQTRAKNSHAELVSASVHNLQTLKQVQSDMVLLAAADCTGHGVPGAFMSMIGNDQLNHIILEGKLTKPSEILTQLNKEIKRALKQDAFTTTDFASQTRDGMDIALISIEYKAQDAEQKNCELNYAGAHRPLWLVRNKELMEYKADKRSIGGLTENDYEFKNNNIEVKKGDMIYLFTDGYSDQFGGESSIISKEGGKKFMTKNLKKLLLTLADEPLRKQKEILYETFEHWKGNFEQVDDVLVIGVRI